MTSPSERHALRSERYALRHTRVRGRATMPPRRWSGVRAAAGVGAAAAVVLTSTACAADQTASDDGANSAEPLHVFAAASLAQVAEEVSADFAEEHGLEVRVTTGGSADVLAQISHGAPADVFLSADTATMDRALAEGLITGTPDVFAVNTLVLITPDTNPAGVSALKDITHQDVSLVTCAPQVPCGALTRDLAEHHGVELSPVSEESSVTEVLAKVAAGEADAGLVYATDPPRAASPVKTFQIPDADAFINEYPAGAIDESDHPMAVEFVEYLQNSSVQDALAEAGFGAP